MLTMRLINCLGSLLVLTAIEWHLNGIGCGLLNSKVEKIERYVPPTSWDLTGNDRFSLSRKLKAPEAEAIRAELFIEGDGQPTMNIKRTEEQLAELASDLKVLAKYGKLDEDDKQIQSGIQALHSISYSVKASNCNQIDADFLFRLEAMMSIYEDFPNIYGYLNGHYTIQLKFCLAMFDQLLYEAWKKVDKRSALESTRLSKAFEQAEAMPRQVITSSGEQINADDGNRNLQIWIALDAISLYLAQQVSTEELAKSRSSPESSRVVQAQLEILAHACDTIRELFSGLARIHELFKTANPNAELKDHMTNDPKGPMAWLRVAKHCKFATMVMTDHKNHIEPAFKRLVLNRQIPDALLRSTSAETWRSIQNVKSKIYATVASQSPDNSMGAQETLDALEKAMEIGSDQNMTPSDYFFDKSEEIELLDVKRTGESRCLNGYWGVFDLLSKKFSQFTVNIQPYLMFFYEQQMALCKENFASLVRKTISDITTDFEGLPMERFNLLRNVFADGILNHNELIATIDRMDSSGLRTLLAKYSERANALGDIRDEVASLEPRDAELEFLSIECHELLDYNLGQLLQTYERIREHSGTIVPIDDKQVIKWLQIGKLCQQIQKFSEF